MNLPYSTESTETGKAGDTVSVVLRERLNSSTVYYTTVCPQLMEMSVSQYKEPSSYHNTVSAELSPGLVLI